MPPVARLLLLVLLCCRLPSNADVINAKHSVVPATSNAIRRVAADAGQPENKLLHASSRDDYGNRKRDGVTDRDNSESAARQQFSDDEFGGDKRKWGKVSLQAWGKRRWNAVNSKAAWGKRDEKRDWLQKDLTDWFRQRQQTAYEKRRWSANNGMRAWGKRSRPDVGGRPKRSVDYDQRRWLPVKRQWRHQTAGSRYGGPKRTWEFNTMKTWGKRNAHVDGRIWPKRRWSSDNSLRVWG